MADPAKTAEDSVEVEGAVENRGEHRGNVLVVDGDDDRAHTQVDNRHDRDHVARHVGEAASAAQNRHGHEDREDLADDPRRPGIRPAVVHEGVSHVVGGQQA